MKLIRIIFAIFLSSMVIACAKDDMPTAPPAVTNPVAEVLEGNYWTEKVCFTYIKRGSSGDNIEVTQDISHEYPWGGGSHYDIRLNNFYVSPETKKVHLFQSGLYIGNWYIQNLYSISYPDQQHIYISSTRELDAFVGAAINVELKVMSCTDHEIVLDGPIKPYIWQTWALDEMGDFLNITYLGIRVYWTKIENGAEIYEPSTPLD